MAVLAGAPPKRYGNGHPSIVPYQSFQTADGWLYVAVGNDAQFKRLCACANCMALWDDARFSTNPGRVTHRDTLIPQLQTLFMQRTTHDWDVLLQANDIPVSPINDVAQVLQDPHVLARGMVQEIDGMRLLGPVAKLSATPAAIQSTPPRLGQHTAQVLHELLGKTDIQIDRLRDERAI